MDRSADPVVVVPAYQPGVALLGLIDELSRAGVRAVVVDDGSGAGFEDIFRLLPEGALLERHESNQGKGTALRSGIARALREYPETLGVVTADADGQHDCDDIIKVAHELASHPGDLLLGVREVSSPAAPIRSRAGNAFSRHAARFVLGLRLVDAQTGLRGLPRHFAEACLGMRASGYEFESDMLIAAKHQGLAIRQIPIGTFYFDGNAGSHFRPLRDSLKIGFVLTRFALLALSTAALDNLVFALALLSGAGAGAAHILARLVAGALNYPVSRRAVFFGLEPHTLTFPRYVLVVSVSGLAAYMLQRAFGSQWGVGLLTAKAAAETLLFPLSFFLLRDFVFSRAPADSHAATDWDGYYRRPFPAAQLTRRYTASVLASAIRQFAPEQDRLEVLEYGGADSCFLEVFTRADRFARYRAVDTNPLGLSRLNGRAGNAEGRCRVEAVQASVLDSTVETDRADVVFSVGLIEHFDGEGTVRAIENHFRSCRPGGLVILSYPTPTHLYRLVRWLAELFGAWRFPDERPLRAEEVRAAADAWGSLVSDRILWPLPLTQRMMVFRR